MSNRILVSPGVFTAEKDLTYVTRQVGVTTLGLVGETPIGPAFEPIYITNYGEFKNYFGGLNPTLVKDTGAPKYELGYIAKSYLSQSNQLYVTRVLGLSGYNAGKAWGLSVKSNYNPDTIEQPKVNETSSIKFTFDEDDDIWVAETGNDDIKTLLNKLIGENLLTGFLNTLNNVDGPFPVGLPLITLNDIALRNGSKFDILNLTDLIVTDSEDHIVYGRSIDITANITISEAGVYDDVDNMFIGLLRSRGNVDATTQVTNWRADTVTLVDVNENDITSPFIIKVEDASSNETEIIVSMDRTQQNYLPRVLGKKQDNGKTPIFAEIFLDSTLQTLINEGKVIGINSTIIDYGTTFYNNLERYQSAITPYVLSQVKGNTISRLFRFYTISDGDSANHLVKISIRNIKLDTREFDVIVRSFYDDDSQPVILESFSRCNMNPDSTNYVGRRIGTLDGFYPAKSNYVMIEVNEDEDTRFDVPAGFMGVPLRDYTDGGNAKNPKISYKANYGDFENVRKAYLGIDSNVGVDEDILNFIGKQDDGNDWLEISNGFHLDYRANDCEIDGESYDFTTSEDEFESEEGVSTNQFEKLYSRKFTLAPYGGFDGWDIYRTRRTNLDTFRLNGVHANNGYNQGKFSPLTLSNGERGLNTDYYAFLEAIWTFRNPEYININVFATPGIDTFNNGSLIEETIEMVETERADSLYIVTTPDTDAGGVVMEVNDVVSFMDNKFDSNYTCTYWPWVQVNDTENNKYIYLPPTRDVIRNIAMTDNVSFPWFVVAGFQRGEVQAVKARKKLNQQERDDLYENRINPIGTFTNNDIRIWGNKTLQVKETALNRVNVRRLLLQARKLISAVAIRLVFEQNDNVVRNQFLSLVNPILENIRSSRGLTDFRVVLSNDPEEIDRNEMRGEIYIKPTRSLEFIYVNFTITNSSVSFDNI